jgi:hypothetical protein
MDKVSKAFDFPAPIKLPTEGASGVMVCGGCAELGGWP